MIVDSVKYVGKQLAYAFNPKNWGAGFSEGLKAVTGKIHDEFTEDTKNFGKETVENIAKSFENISGGKAKKISSLIPDLLADSKGEVGAVAEELGTEAGKKFKQGYEIEMPKTMDFTSDGTELPEIDTTAIETFTTYVDESFKQMNEIVQGSVNDLFVTIGESLGDIVSGGGLKSAMQGLLGLLSNFMASFGKVLIAIGVAKLSLEKLFKAGPAGAFAAIAAGVTLIGLSKIASNMFAKNAGKFAQGGIIGGYSFSGDRVPILANSGEMVLNQQQQSSLFKQLNNGGNGGSLTARVAGNDLLFILEQAQKKRSFSY
jgi:hypothetical protein